MVASVAKVPEVPKLLTQYLPTFDTSYIKTMVVEVAVLGFSGNFFLGSS